MNKYCILACLVVLSACATNQHESDNGFYTWIDASGNVRTEHRKKEQAQAKTEAEEASSNQFDPADFTPSEQMDKQLQGDKLYAWMEDGRQIISEPTQAQLEQNDLHTNNQPKLNIRATQSGLIDTAPLKKAKIWQYIDVLGREINLAKYYSYSKILGRDYLLIDLYELNNTSLTIRTFAKEQALAFPHFIQLDKKLNIVSEKEVDWDGYNHESWASYGYLTGRISLSPETSFLLIITREDAGAMQVDGELIKLVDLGSIEISNNE